MSERKGEQKQPPKCPPQNELPPSEIVWQGRVPHLGEYCRCRIVLRYAWKRYAEAGEWEATPEYLYERADTKDAMRNPRYETQPKMDIPDHFFAEVLHAFQEVARRGREGAVGDGS